MSTLPPYERIDPAYLVEEETVSGYNPKHYYPVKLGEVLGERFETIGKLGFGPASTVWLCRDRRNHDKYVALKVYVNNSKFHRELPIYDEINSLQTTHEGQKYIRKMYDSFELQGPHGTHICLVHQPLGISLGELKELAPGGMFSPDLLRQTMRCILTGLRFLHDELRVIHTDLQPSNMLLGIHDDSALYKFEQNETEAPCPRKDLEDRTIYLSRPMPLTKGEPSITDLSEARFGDSTHTDRIMPNVYRAPEVILGLPWSYPVDIWAFAMVLWDLFEPTRLIQRESSGGRYSESHHLAEMIAIMGLPPLDFLRQCGDVAVKYWEKDGAWKNLAPIPQTSLEQIEQRLKGVEKQNFIAFIRKMLQWKPEERRTSEEIYWDGWLLAGEVGGEDMHSGCTPRPGQHPAHDANDPIC